MQNLTLRAILAAGLLASASAAIRAEDGAMTGLHEKRVEGGRWCMADHPHFGNGSGPTQKAAQAAAIKDWNEFTAWEYGIPWGNFNNAGSRRVGCTGGVGSFTCEVSARPCRPLTAGEGGAGSSRRVKKR